MFSSISSNYIFVIATPLIMLFLIDLLYVLNFLSMLWQAVKAVVADRVLTVNSPDDPTGKTSLKAPCGPRVPMHCGLRFK